MHYSSLWWSTETYNPRLTEYLAEIMPPCQDYHFALTLRRIGNPKFIIRNLYTYSNLLHAVLNVCRGSVIEKCWSEGQKSLAGDHRDVICTLQRLENLIQSRLRHKSFEIEPEPASLIDDSHNSETFTICEENSSVFIPHMTHLPGRMVDGSRRLLELPNDVDRQCWPGSESNTSAAGFGSLCRAIFNAPTSSCCQNTSTIMPFGASSETESGILTCCAPTGTWPNTQQKNKLGFHFHFWTTHRTTTNGIETKRVSYLQRFPIHSQGLKPAFGSSVFQIRLPRDSQKNFLQGRET